MSALDELIYDRTQTDVTYAAELNRKLGRGESLTSQELADWNAGLKGAYNASDMNRVDAAVRELGGMLTAAGYPVEYTNPHSLAPDEGVSLVQLNVEYPVNARWIGASGSLFCAVAHAQLTAGVIQGTMWCAASQGGTASSNAISYSGQSKLDYATPWEGVTASNTSVTGVTLDGAAVDCTTSIGSDHKISFEFGVDSLDAGCHALEVTMSRSAGTYKIVWYFCLASGVDDMPISAAYMRAGCYLYASGEFSNTANYISTGSVIPVLAGLTLTVLTSIEILSDCGFVWYDADMNFISGTTVGAPIQWDGCFQAIPPENTAYCNVNINATGVTPGSIGTVFARQEPEPENAVLPDGYSSVEYIESTGAEYIDTGYQASSQTKIVMKVKTTNIATAAYPAYFGTRDNGAVQNAFGLFLRKDTDVVYSQYGTQSIKISSGGLLSAENSEFVTITMSNVLDVNNTIICTHQLQSFTSNQNLYLFATNDGSPYEYGTFAIGSCVIYDNDVIVRYYRPCVNDSGIAGLYDTVSGIFFGNAASGSVKPVDLPQGYTQVEYIQTSSSGGQYIDTGYKPNSNTRAIIAVQNFPRTKTNQTLFGSRTGVGATDAYCFLTTSQNVYRTDYSNQAGNYDKTVSFANDLVIDKNKNITTLNGSNVSTLSAKTFSGSYNFYIAAMNNGGSPSFYTTEVRIYNCQIYDSSKLMRNYIPSLHNNIAGLFDTVGNAFYSNAGTGSFINGDIVSKGFEHGDIIPMPQPEPINHWGNGDIITYDIWSTYLSNVQALRDAYYAMPNSPELPEPTAPLTYTGANAIERLIYDIYMLYDAMVASYRLCGAFKCGSNAQHLPLQRSVI